MIKHIATVSTIETISKTESAEVKATNTDNHWTCTAKTMLIETGNRLVESRYAHKSSSSIIK